MAHIRRKLHSSSGASMLLGLLFLLFCLTVGAVVLTAASVSAGRTQRNRQVQQNYLAVQSAANLLMDDMVDMEFKGIFTYAYYTYYHIGTNPDGTTYTYTTHNIRRSNTAELPNTGFKSLLLDYFRALFLSAPALDSYRETASAAPGPLTAALTVSAPGTDGDHKLPPVALSLTAGTPFGPGVTPVYADEGFTVSAKLALSTPAAEGDHALELGLQPVVKFETASRFTPGNPECTTTTITCHVTWEAPEVTKPEQEAKP